MSASHPQTRARLRPRAVPADRLYFPVAAAYAMIAVPLWVAAAAGWVTAPGGQWHAHEMLFGYALLVVAGYLVGRARRIVLAALLLAWLAARIAPWITGAGSAAAIAPQLAFSLAVAAYTAWPFLRAAKKLQNRVFAAVFVAFFLCDAAYQAGLVRNDAAMQSAALTAAVDVYVLLLAMMGGRVIPAAVAGHYYREGRVLEARVQPALEKAAILLLVAMTVLDLVPGARTMAGACALGAAAITAVRWWRWRPWSVLREPHLWTLALGYGWLVPGLAWKGYAAWTGGGAPGSVVHALTVGALGTLTLVMIARTRLQRSKGGLAPLRDIGAAALLVSGAAMARLAVPALPEHALAALWLAALLWSAAYALLLRRLLGIVPRPGDAMPRASHSG